MAHSEGYGIWACAQCVYHAIKAAGGCGPEAFGMKGTGRSDPCAIFLFTGELHRASGATLAVIRRWQAAVGVGAGGGGAAPFIWNGFDYEVKMEHDLDFLQTSRIAALLPCLPSPPVPLPAPPTHISAASPASPDPPALAPPPSVTSISSFDPEALTPTQQAILQDLLMRSQTAAQSSGVPVVLGHNSPNAKSCRGLLPHVEGCGHAVAEGRHYYGRGGGVPWRRSECSGWGHCWGGGGQLQKCRDH